MRRIILLVLFTIVVSGCAFQGRFSESGTFPSVGDCDDTGGTFVNLFYDNRQIRTVAVAHIEPGEIFAIRLKPSNDGYNRPTVEGGSTPVDYRDFDVTVSGKDGFPASAWLSAGPASWNTATDHELVICVPNDLERPSRYYYTIDIDQAGSLDPRADVC